MAKRTHHTNNNQNRKHHRNGIKRPKRHRLVDTPGINDKRLKSIHSSRLRNQEVMQ